MRYLHGLAIDELLARTDASNTSAWYLTDRLGTVRDIANTSGTVIYHAAYDSYGQVTSETNPSNGDRFKFTGREFDKETSDYYYRARYYDPVVGRFTAQDPLGFEAGDANLYRYVGNSPTNATDPLGMVIMSPSLIGAILTDPGNGPTNAREPNGEQLTDTDVNQMMMRLRLRQRELDQKAAELADRKSRAEIEHKARAYEKIINDPTGG